MLTLTSCFMLLLAEFLGIEIHTVFFIIWIACTFYCGVADILLMAALVHIVENYQKREREDEERAKVEY